MKESYSNGSSWYRVYSDGWIEQGGYSTNATSNSANSVVLSFAKPFKNQPYVFTQKGDKNATSVSRYPTNDWFNQQELVYNVTTTSFKTSFFTNNGYAGCQWYACGY